MRSLWLSTSSNETSKYIDGFQKVYPGESLTIHYDDPANSETAIYARAKEFRPEVIIYIGSRWGRVISPVMLAAINANVAPMVHFCSDAADQPWWSLLRDYHNAGAFTVQVAIDGNKAWPLAESGMTLLTPVDPEDFPNRYRPHAERLSVCGYAGNCGGTGSMRRAILIDMLATDLIDLHARNDLPHTYRIFCRFLERCRLSLNISFSGTESAKQVKGRVIESAMAGCCLLEVAGSPTSDWFTPGEDYLEYASTSEARDIIKRLENDPDESQRIAENLRSKVIERHSLEAFWSQIIERVGMKAAA